jgi:hypothetical protein
MDFKKAKRNKKWDSWITIILLTLLLLCTFFFISKFNYTVDLTKEKKYSLSLETISRLNKISSSIDIIITIPENNNQPKIIQKLLFDLGLILESFQNTNSKFPIRIHRINIDTALSSSGLIDKYKLTERNVISIFSQTGNKQIIFKYEDIEGVNVLDRNNIFRSKDSLARENIWESGFYGNWKESTLGVMEPTEFRGEEVILRSILAVASAGNKRKVAYFTRGHGEGSPSDVNSMKGFSELRTILENQNIKVATIDLSTVEKIPMDSRLIIVAGPKGTFQDQEISVIREYLNHEKGKVLFALDPTEEISMIDKPAFGFRQIFKEWGIRCHDMLIYDPEKNNFDLFTGDYSLKTYFKDRPHQIINKLRDGGYSIQSTRLRPVETIEHPTGDFKTSEILFSRNSSWAVSSWTNREFPPDKNNLLDMEGPVPVIALSEIDKLRTNNKISSKGKIAVLGSSSILTNKRIKNNSGNLYLCKNLISWLTEDIMMLEIDPKPLNSYTLNLNSKQFEDLLYALSIIPIIVGLLGAFVGWLRKEL